MTILIVTANSAPVNASGDHETNADDGYIREAFPNDPFETSNPKQTTKFASGDHNHMLVKFGLGTVSGATINSATLYLYKSGGENTHTISAFRLKRDWSASTCTWNIFSTSNSWGTAGANNTTSDIDGVATASVSPTSNSSWWSWNVTADVADFASGAETNYGWKLERTDGADDATFVQWLAADEISDLRPELVIDYTAGGGATPKGPLGHPLRGPFSGPV